MGEENFPNADEQKELSNHIRQIAQTTYPTEYANADSVFVYICCFIYGSCYRRRLQISSYIRLLALSFFYNYCTTFGKSNSGNYGAKKRKA